jgi:ABC-type Na+ efflux pump permease subunit
VLAVADCATAGTARAVWARPFNGFYAAVGLGLVSLLTPATLAEERGRGSLDVLLSTPLSTRSLVLCKWLACYRLVPFLALLPAAVAAAHAREHQRWPGVLMVMGMILAHGATVTSLGIALAT